MYEQGEAPCVYSVVVNNFKIDQGTQEGENKEGMPAHQRTSIVVGDTESFWKLVKVGVTATDTTPKAYKNLQEKVAAENRMETVETDVLKWCTNKTKKTDFTEDEVNMAAILSVLRVESKTDIQTEKDVRHAMGLVISKELAKMLSLPIHTEWILTSQAYLDKLRQTIEETREAKKEMTCKLISENRFPANEAFKKKQPKELQLRNGKTVAVEIQWTGPKDNPTYSGEIVLTQPLDTTSSEVSKNR